MQPLNSKHPCDAKGRRHPRQQPAGLSLGSPPFDLAKSPTKASQSRRANGTPTRRKNKSSSEEKEDLTDGRILDEHTLSLSDLSHKFATPIREKNVAKSKGLAAADRAKKLAEFGPNVVTPPKPTPEIFKFLSQFLNLLIVMLAISGVMSLVAYLLDRTVSINLWLALVLFGDAIISATTAYIGERSSSAFFKLFKNIAPAGCKVVQDGVERQDIPSNLVVGDLVRIASGDRVPADLRIIYSNELKIESSAITGESEAVVMTAEPAHPGTTAHDATNIAYSSSLVTEGEGYGVVIRTGDKTAIGRIARLAGHQKQELTPMQKEVKHFVFVLAVGSLILAVIFFVVGAVQNPTKILTVFINSFVVVLIANVPQGLPATVTSLLTITGRRMARANFFVKRLDSVETLGSCTVVASDKTGTLTENKMSVEHLWFDRQPSSYKRIFQNPTHYFKSEAFASLFRVAALCSRVKVSPADDVGLRVSMGEPRPKSRSSRASDEWRDEVEANDAKGGARRSAELRRTSASLDIRRSMDLRSEDLKLTGDASEVALYRFCASIRNLATYQENYPKLFEVPFNSRNKYQLSIHQMGPSGGKQVLVIKGAPEVILAMCTTRLQKGAIQQISKHWREDFDTAYQKFGAAGERVLGFAELLIPKELRHKEYTSAPEPNYPLSGFTFVGLISLMDPPRQGVAQAVADCKTAGIKVIMVTGDAPSTAEAIARKTGIIGSFMTKQEAADYNQIDPAKLTEEDYNAIVVHGGHEIPQFKEEDWERVLAKEEIVFARTTPEQKLQIVTRLQAQGHVVAVTGDGVNDAPALKRADIGVAMGIAGTEVAKDAADAILLDDNFSSIVVGIRHGRLVFDNLKKTAAYTLSHLWPEVVPTLCNLAFSLPLAISSLMILAIDLGTELAPAISLAYEPAESDIMKRRPRPRTERMISWQIFTYAYAFIGNFQTLVCFLTFFMVFRDYGIPANFSYFDIGTGVNTTIDATRQVSIFTEAATGYWVTLTMCQFAHIWMVKTRRVSVFRHGFFSNAVQICGCLFQLALIVNIVYLPFWQSFWGTGTLGGVYWTYWLVGLGIIWLFDEMRKLWGRNFPRSSLTRLVLW